MITVNKEFHKKFQIQVLGIKTTFNFIGTSQDQNNFLYLLHFYVDVSFHHDH